jgi:phage terminase large subunit-like protein
LPGAKEVKLFFERCLTHHKGELSGSPFLLSPWQYDGIIKPLFNAKNPDGSRQYRTCFVEVPRKNGKSTLAAGIALYLLFADGEPGAEVVSAAADREQARIVFDLAVNMVQASPVLSARSTIYRSHIETKSGSIYKVISAEAYSKHGMNLHGIIFDEIHAQPNRELWDVLTTATVSRKQPLTFAITTAGHDRSSLCYELHTYAKNILEGSVEDPTFLPVIYAAEPDEDWAIEPTWKKANPGYGVSVKPEYFVNAVREAKILPNKEQAFRRLHLCQWTESYSRWIALDRWDACQAEETYDREGNSCSLAESLRFKECYVGLDLASNVDLAAMSLLFPGEDGEYSVLLYSFAPAEADRKRERANKPRFNNWARDGWIGINEGNSIDYEAIRKKLHELAEQYQVKEVAIDRWNATHLITLLQEDGFTVVPFGQGMASMTGPTKEFESLVLDGKLKHDGNPVLRWNVANVVIEEDAAGNRKPNKARSSDKIDGVVATLMALGRALVRTQSGSVYDSSEVFTL